MSGWRSITRSLVYFAVSQFSLFILRAVVGKPLTALFFYPQKRDAMILRKVTATWGAKYNLGDYNSLHIEVTLDADVEEGETIEQVTKALLDAAKEQVRDQAKDVLAKRKAQVQEVMAGIPVEVRDQLK